MSRYSLEPDGLYYLPPSKIDKQGNHTEQEPSWLCSRVPVVSLAVDEDGCWGKLLNLVNPDKKLVPWLMPARMLAKKDELWQALLEKGLSITADSKSRDFLHAYLNDEQPSGRARVMTRLGWYLDNGI